MTTKMGCLSLAVMCHDANTLALRLQHIFIWNISSSWKSTTDPFWGVFATQSRGLYGFKEQKSCILPPHHPLEKLLLPFSPEQSQAVITSTGLVNSSPQLLCELAPNSSHFFKECPSLAEGPGWNFPHWCFSVMLHSPCPHEAAFGGWADILAKTGKVLTELPSLILVSLGLWKHINICQSELKFTLLCLPVVLFTINW